jgi:hypothetical protein
MALLPQPGANENEKLQADTRISFHVLQYSIAGRWCTHPVTRVEVLGRQMHPPKDDLPTLSATLLAESSNIGRRGEINYLLYNLLENKVLFCREIVG